ncbi:MAG: cytochrome c biogenesis protein CcsA [Deinococcota bacterium]
MSLKPLTLPRAEAHRPAVTGLNERPTWLNALAGVSLALFAIGLYMALVTSPPDVQQGQLIRIMYAHVSVAWICFLAIFICAIFGCLYLWRGNRTHDVIACASAELACFYAGLTLVGGMTYSRPTLNTWWAWDAKLTATALLFVLLVGYFIVRGILDDPQRRGRVSAVISLIILADVPIIYFASEWWRTLHPSKAINLDGSGITMDPSMLQTLLVNVGIAALIYGLLMVERVRIGKLEVRLEQQHYTHQERNQPASNQPDTVRI